MIKKNSLSYFLLLALEKAVESGTPILDFLDNPHTFVMTGYRTNLNYSNFYKTIKAMRKNGYIETPRDGRKILLKLTDKGRQALILRKLLENKSWDGKWRIVIFDIPEKHRKVRNALRTQLRLWEFQPWQKSVWVSKKDVSLELKKLTKELGISNWVKILVASEI